MFELLLQADKALAGGLLDQAERTYWQLIELDPTNSMAIAGLARVALERGDERSARTFAGRAVAIDADSIAARRVLDTLDHRAARAEDAGAPELPLAAAQRLEALSRRRLISPDRPGGLASSFAAVDPSGSKRRANRTRDEIDAQLDEVEPAGDEQAADEQAADEQADPGRSPDGGTRSDLMPQLPSEPLMERRQAGRLAAAAAAAATAMQRPARNGTNRPEPQHAMPAGRRRFDAEEFRGPAHDPFAAAESAAAVEAIDAVDVTDEVPAEGPESKTPTVPEDAIASASDAAELERTGEEAGADDSPDSEAEAAAAEESIALRISLVTEAAERESSWDVDEAVRRTFEMAEMGAAVAAVDAEPQAAEADEADARAAETRSAEAAEPASDHPGESETVEPHPTDVAGTADAEAALHAELLARDHVAGASVDAFHAALMAELQARQLDADSRAPSPAAGDPPASSLPPPGTTIDDEWGQSEQEAETQALREALAIVLGGRGEDGDAAPGQAPPAATPPTPDTPRGAEPGSPAVRSADQGQGAEPAEPSERAPAPAPVPEQEPEPPAPRRKKGFFRRFGGS